MLATGALLTGLPAAATSAHDIDFGYQTWTVGPLPDASAPIANSSPNVANLPGGPAVVVGDQTGNVYAYNLVTGAPVWNYNAGAPVNSTPSVAVTGADGPYDSVFVDTGDPANPFSGGYQAISPTGTKLWSAQESNPSTDLQPHNGVQASLAVGNLQGGTDVTAGSLGEEQDAFNAASGAMLPGFPWYQADSDFTTPALADLYGNGQTDIVEGSDSTQGSSYGTSYANGGHLRILSNTGNAGLPQPNDGMLCQYNTDETVQSSPAVGPFLGASNELGIVFGTGITYHQSDTDKLIAVDTHCNQKWVAPLSGNTASSPALADVMGNGQLQVVEGVDNGTSGAVYAINGSNGSILWQTNVDRVIGSVVTADLGTGYQDVLAPTVNGVAVLDGKTGAIITTLQAQTGFQNAPLITDDPNGTIGITLAGYQATGSYIYHYEIAGSNGSLVNENGAWPQYHHDPQLTGNAGGGGTTSVPCAAPATAPEGYYLAASDGDVSSFGNVPYCGSPIGLNKPVVGMAATADGGGYWLVAADGGIFTYGDAQFYGSAGAIHLNKPIVGMAPTADGKGYWLVASDGGIFNYGDASFHGSAGNLTLNKPVVGMAAAPNGSGYWLVASDGGVFSYSVPFYGSTGNIRLNEPIVGMQTTPTGQGYRFVASDGGVFNYGDAQSYGSLGASGSSSPIVSIAGF
jgi:hypothetical protein